MLEAVGDLDDTGVWESITVSDPSSNTNVLLQATLYMASFQAQGMENNATRTTPRLAEPSLVWDPPTAKCNTKTVLQQLGARTSEIPIAQRRTFHFASPLRLTGDSMETNDSIYSARLGPVIRWYGAQRRIIDFQRHAHVHEKSSHGLVGLLYKVMFYMLL
ncbi:hypothetical protein FOMG_14005 [Fusarium oxysporum f. sp. melonis 26406]|uniref:Uncharacterized protein n=1 Tax=Fusarium oxysporum f. sp. melonis 26406 TaxID=1089452 RepID=X0A8M7_FUSOX|nr:hypothetical protein FOMG_14005 [Fusarium oxysporum f. sp. melonis 26406]